MRSWALFFSAMFASLSSVLSLVVPFCSFLHFYHGNLFVTASERLSSRGIEVMLYLIPFLMLFAFIIFLIILSSLKAPSKVLEIKQILKVIVIIALSWFGLIFLIQFLDGMINDVLESLAFGVIGLVIIFPPLIVGLVSGNAMYLIVNKKLFYNLGGNKLTDKKFTDNKMNKFKHSPL